MNKDNKINRCSAPGSVLGAFMRKGNIMEKEVKVDPFWGRSDTPEYQEKLREFNARIEAGNKKAAADMKLESRIRDEENGG